MQGITREILYNSFSDYEKKQFVEFAKIIEDAYQDKERQRVIWMYDKSIGGYGGYAAPLNPTVNPFNRLGDFRNVFRSLQYARCDMFFCNRPRHIIMDAGLHVESLVKLLLAKNKFIKYVSEKREFGKNIFELYKKEIIDDNLFERLNDLRKVLNLAKHDTAPDRDNTFDYMDAIVFYFEVRKVGVKLLKLLVHESYSKVYEINDKY